MTLTPPNEGFPRSRRLLTAADFDAVFKHRDFSYRSRSIRLIGRHSPNGARLGLVVAKRVLPRAVDRNQVKRQIREAFRLWHARLPSVDLVVQPLQLDVLENPREQVESLLRRVVRERV